MKPVDFATSDKSVQIGVKTADKHVTAAPVTRTVGCYMKRKTRSGGTQCGAAASSFTSKACGNHLQCTDNSTNTGYYTSGYRVTTCVVQLVKASDTQAVGRGTRIAGSSPVRTINIGIKVIFIIGLI